MSGIVSSQKHTQYRPDIDGLRAIAVSAVVIFHAFPNWINSGFVGVDIFFVISGFLISSVILTDLRRDTFSYLDFYVRRVRRIFPALALVLGTCLLLGWFLAYPDEYESLGKHVAAGAAFVSNIALWRETGYFNPMAETKPLMHLWSLGIEEQFYIVWPLLVAFLYGRTRGFLPIVSVLALASFFLNIWFIKSAPGATFYLPVTRFWELLAGALLAYVTSFYGGLAGALETRFPPLALSPRRRRLLHNLSSWTGLVLISAAIALTDRRAFPGWWALLPTIGSFLIISAGPEAWFNRKILSHGAVVFVGLISYPLYLWHWPLLTLFARYFEFGQISLTVRGMLVVLSIFLAWVTYRWLEIPIRTGNLTRRTPAILVVVVAILAVCGLGIFQDKGQSARLGHNALALDLAHKPSADAYLPCSNDSAQMSARIHQLIDYCVQSFPSAPVVAVFGDSHAEHIYPGLAQSEQNQSWLLVGHNSCPPVNGIDVEGTVLHCRERTEEITRSLARMESIQVVVLSFFGGYFLDSDVAADHLANHAGPTTISIRSNETTLSGKKDLFFFGLDRTIAILEKAGKKVVVVVDVPELPFFPRDKLRYIMIKNESGQTASLAKSSVVNRQSQLRAGIAQLKIAHPALLIYDPMEFLCDDTACHIVIDDVLIYRDSHHLSSRGSMFFARKFLDVLTRSPGHGSAP